MTYTITYFYLKSHKIYLVNMFRHKSQIELNVGTITKKYLILSGFLRGGYKSSKYFRFFKPELIFDGF